MAPGGIEPPRADSKSAALSAELRGRARVSVASRCDGLPPLFDRVVGSERPSSDPLPAGAGRIDLGERGVPVVPGGCAAEQEQIDPGEQLRPRCTPGSTAWFAAAAKPI